MLEIRKSFCYSASGMISIPFFTSFPILLRPRGSKTTRARYAPVDQQEVGQSVIGQMCGAIPTWGLIKGIVHHTDRFGGTHGKQYLAVFAALR